MEAALDVVAKYLFIYLFIYLFGLPVQTLLLICNMDLKYIYKKL